MEDRVERSADRVAQDRGLFQGHRLRHAHERFLGHGDVLGPAAVELDPHVRRHHAALDRIAVPAPRANAAPLAGKDRDAIALVPCVDARADFRDHASRFVAGDERRRPTRRERTIEHMEVARADPARGDFDEYLAGTGLRDGPVLYLEWLAGAIEPNRAHQPIAASSVALGSRPEPLGPENIPTAGNETPAARYSSIFLWIAFSSPIAANSSINRSLIAWNAAGISPLPSAVSKVFNSCW